MYLIFFVPAVLLTWYLLKRRHFKLQQTARTITNAYTLTAVQINHINRTHQSFASVYPIHIQELIKYFNETPNTEIKIWLKMRASYLNFIQVAKSCTFEQHKAVFRVFVHCLGCLTYLSNEKKVTD